MWFGLAADVKHFNEYAEGKLSVFAETVITDNSSIEKIFKSGIEFHFCFCFCFVFYTSNTEEKIRKPTFHAIFSHSMRTRPALPLWVVGEPQV